MACDKPTPRPFVPPGQPSSVQLPSLWHGYGEQVTLPSDLWQHARYPDRVVVHAFATYASHTREPGIV